MKDIYWLAGIIEGEGSFTHSRKKVGGAPLAKITINMTDQDVLERVASITKSNLLGPYTRKENNRKDYKPWFSVQMRGNKAIQWMMTLYSLMGNRRKSKIEEILISWKQHQSQRGKRLA